MGHPHDYASVQKCKRKASGFIKPQGERLPQERRAVAAVASGRTWTGYSQTENTRQRVRCVSQLTQNPSHYPKTGRFHHLT